MIHKILQNFKTLALRNPVFERIWKYYRQDQLHKSYRQRREYYAKVAKNRHLIYNESEIIAAVRSRIRARDYSPSLRRVGDVHTFAIIPQISWHNHLLPDLEELGRVSIFDYISFGYSPDNFYGVEKWSKKRINNRIEMVNKIMPALKKAHQKQPVDWVLCYGGGHNISGKVTRQITEEFGIPTIDMTFDDKHGWAGPTVGEHCAGARDITSAFDIFFTSASVACEWHLLEGGRGIYMPEGFDNSYYHPRDVKKDIPASFVGGAYGFRKSVVRYLRKHDIPIQTYGNGWDGSGHANDIVDIFNRSVINLGMGGIGYSESLTNVKGRDFEIPGTGGGVYITSYNPDLAQHFVIGKEILCYRNRDEMLELIRYYLTHPEEAGEIARCGRERCIREHRWGHRYEKILGILGILPDNDIEGV